jgi:hypothetical protein
MNNIVISFGCPRSGTTFIEAWLENRRAFLYQKLREGDMLHPCQSEDGLIRLAQLFRRQNLIFVRTKRSYREIIDSFFAARLPGAKNAKGIGANSNERIIKFIVDEELNYQKQKAELATIREIPFRIVELNYNKMHDSPYQLETAMRIAKHLPRNIRLKTQEEIQRWLILNFGKNPVREGKLSHKIKKQVAPEDIMQGMLAEIESQINGD